MSRSSAHEQSLLTLTSSIAVTGLAAVAAPEGVAGELEASLEEHLGQISQAEFVPEPPPNHEEDDVGGELKEVERRAGPVVEPSRAGAAPMARVAQRRDLLELGRRTR